MEIANKLEEQIIQFHHPTLFSVPTCPSAPKIRPVHENISLITPLNLPPILSSGFLTEINADDETDVSDSQSESEVI